MARLDGKLTHQFLTTVLPDFVVERFAAAIGVVERDRKVDIVLLIWTLILGFPAGSKRTLASLRRRFQQMLGETIARSSFHGWLTPKPAVLMRRLVDWCLDRQSQRVCPELSEQFDGFKELLAIDSTVFRLHKLLAKRWPSTNAEQAAAKLHVVSNVVEGTAESVRLSDHKTHDQGPLKTIGSWVKDCLLLLDLGYYNFHLFWRINQQDGFFLSRTKSNANPRIVASHQTVPGNSIDLAGKKLQKVLGRLKRRVIDAEVSPLWWTVYSLTRTYRSEERDVTRTIPKRISRADSVAVPLQPLCPGAGRGVQALRPDDPKLDQAGRNRQWRSPRWIHNGTKGRAGSAARGEPQAAPGT